MWTFYLAKQTKKKIVKRARQLDPCPPPISSPYFPHPGSNGVITRAACAVILQHTWSRHNVSSSLNRKTKILTLIGLCMLQNGPAFVKILLHKNVTFIKNKIKKWILVQIALLECTSFLNYLIVLSKYLNIKKTIMSKVDPELEKKAQSDFLI